MAGGFIWAATLYDIYVTVLQAAITVGVALSLLTAVDRLLHVAHYLQLKLVAWLTGKGPEATYRCQAMPDPAQFAHMYPKVAIQLPMFNERMVCQTIVDCACSLQWPKDKLIVQVLDDSTDKLTRDRVDDSVLEWRERGVNVMTIRRTNRQGYKAGALKEGLELLREYEYVAIFDADFRPESDFLVKMIPYIHSNDDVGYVQARWTFTNADESLLTKAQELSLNYHVKCEQWVHFASGSFFNFNGTAGIWRRKTIEDVGGWNARTTVEDMDLSLRAYIAGWKAIFLDNITCLNELPSSYFAFRKQQHRWSCGPVQLWRRSSAAIWASKLPFLRKVELNFLTFFLRKVACHIVALLFFCTLVPLSIFTPEVSIPLWALVHLPVTVTVSTAIFSPKDWYYVVIQVLFENAMSIVKLWAVVNGAFDLQRANEWVVTSKKGSGSDKLKRLKAIYSTCRAYTSEVLLGIFTVGAGVFAIIYVHRISFSVFLLLQGFVFIAFGLNLVDHGNILGRPLRCWGACCGWRHKGEKTKGKEVVEGVALNEVDQ